MIRGFATASEHEDRLFLNVMTPTRATPAIHNASAASRDGLTMAAV